MTRALALNARAGARWGKHYARTEPRDIPVIEHGPRVLFRQSAFRVTTIPGLFAPTTRHPSATSIDLTRDIISSLLKP